MKKNIILYVMAFIILSFLAYGLSTSNLGNINVAGFINQTNSSLINYFAGNVTIDGSQACTSANGLCGAAGGGGGTGNITEVVAIGPQILGGGTNGSINISLNNTLNGLTLGGTTTLDGFTLYQDTLGHDHVLQADGSSIDRLRSGVFLNPVDITYFSNTTGIYVNVTSTAGDTIKINLDEKQINTGVTSYIILLNNGSASNPATNFVYITNSTTPVVEISATESTVEAISHVWITRAIVGNFSGSNYNIYSTADGDDLVQDFLHKIDNRLYHEGIVYESGLSPTVTTTNINISTGTYFFKMFLTDSSNTVALNTEAFLVNSSGDYVSITAITDITQYSDTGASIASNKYYNIDWGLVISDGTVRLIALVQKQPSTEYTSISAALADDEVKRVSIPNIDLLKHSYIPVARTIIQRTADQFQIVDGTNRYLDIRGAAGGTGGGAPTPSITDHDLLNNLDAASSGHIGFIFADGSIAFTGNQSLGGFSLTNVGTIISSILKSGDWSNFTGTANQITDFNTSVVAIAIDSVIAGTGLLGGGTEGDITLNVSATACNPATEQSIFNGTHFNCGTDAGAGGGMTDWTASNGTVTESITDGEQVNFTAGTGISIAQSTSEFTITSTIVDTNETTRVDSLITSNTTTNAKIDAVNTTANIQGLGFVTGSHIGNCSSLDSCVSLLYSANLNTFSELQSQIADETLIKAGTLTDGQWCSYASATTDISCTVTPITNNNQLANGAGYVTTDTTYTASGNYMILTGTVFSWNETYGNLTYINNGETAAGDLSGTYPNPLVVDDSHNHIVSNIDAATSATWAGQITDESGTGVFVFTDSPTFTTAVTVPDAFNIGNKITHSGDTNTEWQVSADQWNAVTGGSSRLTINNLGVQISNGDLDLNQNNLIDVGNINVTGNNITNVNVQYFVSPNGSIACQFRNDTAFVFQSVCTV